MPSVLIIAPSWVGDTMMSQPLLKSLKKDGYEIDVVAAEWTYALLKYMPEIRNVIFSPFGHGDIALRARYEFGKKLREKKYDKAIVLPNSFKSAIIPWAAGIPLRTGWLGEYRYFLLNDIHYQPKKYQKQVERYTALYEGALDESILPTLSVTKSQQEEILKYFNLDQKRQVLALCPGAAFGSAKCWPKEYYAEIAKAKRREGYEIWLFGSENERYILDFISKELNHECRNFAGNPLDKTVILLSLADCVVCNDSGLMHIAAAFNKPIFALFGPTDQRFTPPLSKHATILSTSLSCQPCGKRVCPLGHHDCMKKITPSVLLENLAARGF